MLHLNKTTQFRKKIFLAIAVIFLSSCIFVQNSSLVSASAGWTAGKFDKSYDFNGQFYIDAGSVSSGVKTVAFWTKATAYDGKVVDLNGSAYVSISSSGVISTTGFTSPTIYIDGVIGTTVNANWHFVTVTTGTAINANAVKFGSVDSDSIVGLLDDVKMYNYALSAREINEKYRQDSPSMAQGGEITGSSAYTALTVTQNGTGQIVSLTNTAIATAAAFTSTNLGSGNSLVINDEAGDTTPFVIDASGRVGIGTTSPTEQLTLTGNIALSSSTSATSGLIKKGTDLLLHTYGTNSTFLGVNAGNLTLTGAGNVGVGYNSLTLTTTGEDNTAIGIWTLSSNTTGSYNTAIGPFSLYDNTEGADNVAVGMNSLSDNISGDSNTAVGVRALNENTAGNNNTATGNRSLMHATGNDNSAFGYYALFSSIGGSGNSAFGRYSLYDNTTGSNNTAVGYNTGLGITTGANNTIIGANVSGLATGLSNTIILADGSGNKRLYVNSSGNVGIGTTTPDGRLSISASSSTGVETNLISIDDLGGTEIGGIRTYNAGSYNQDMRFYVANGSVTPTVYNAMTIVGETGNVGIGTAAPGAKLTIQQDGTGNIVDFKDGANSVFTISDGGNITMNGLSFTQNAVDPVLKSSLIDATNFGGAKSVYMQGKYAYVAGSSTDSLAIIDISVPATPVLAGKLIDATNLNGASSVHISGKYAYVADYDGNSLAVVDVSNPYAPTLAGIVTDATKLNQATSVYVSGKYAYATGYANSYISIVDIGDPTSPVIVGSLVDATNMHGPSSVYVQGKYAYVAADLSTSIAIVDIGDPTAPTLAGQLIDATNIKAAKGIYVSGKYAYIASYDNILSIINISNPASPAYVAKLTDATNFGGAKSVYVSGDYAYVGGYTTDSVAVVNISDPTTPVLAGELLDGTNMNGASAVYVQGNYAYVASELSSSLAVLEIAGFDIPTANIGDLSVSTIDVTDNASIANNLYVGNGLNVGPGGIFSDGPLAGYVDSSATALTVSQDGTGILMDIMDTGVSIFKVGQATVDITRPLDLQVEGDVGIEYNLRFMNNSSSYITSAGPLTISAGDNNSYENLTLTASGTGDVVIDIAGSTLGFKVVGAASRVFSIDPSGNVIIGGTDAGDGNLTVKGNISTQGGNLDLNSLATPSSVAVAPVGTAGSTTYGYRISAINDNGQTLASATTTTTTGNATLSSTNYNRVSWGAVAGATGYKVYGRTSGSELLMATVDSPVLMYKDTNANTPSGALPTTNTTGGNNITYAATNGPKRSIILTAAGAEIPSSNGAAQTKVTGTYHTYYVLDFDATTDESAYWHWTMPDSYDGGAIDVTYYWESVTTGATDTTDVGWCFQSLGITANGNISVDSNFLSVTCEVDRAATTTLSLASVTETQATSNFTAGQYVAFKVFRDADQSIVGAGNDDMAGDARLLKVKIEYSVNAESD
ncbi:MAG: hypothetical protein PHX30_00005 [Candidatus Pacebacteria bacterium]|nr:hypothetical protein [Candidatus Paceibacterota bacterium]